MNPTPVTVQIRDFLPVPAIARAKRPVPITAVIENPGPNEAAVLLRLPSGVRIVAQGTEAIASIGARGKQTFEWVVEAAAEMHCELRLEVKSGGAIVAEAELPLYFLPAVEVAKRDYIPEPVPAKSRVLIGAHHCPLWDSDQLVLWDNVIKHPERTPALGFYSQDNPEVSDWETLWACEHGIDFFIYCWYRTTQGGPITTRFSSAIHEGLFKSRYADKMRFTIMWENQDVGNSGVADMNDLKDNLFPFWMENFFKHPSYLKIDNKPVLFVYRPDIMADDLGGVENGAEAVEWMRQACRDAGFDGLYVLGEHRYLHGGNLEKMKQMGFDSSFSYCWYIPDNPTPEEAIVKQLAIMKSIQDLGILPQLPTVSQAWSGWHDEGTIWKIPPPQFETLLRKAVDYMATLPANELGSQMLLLDNWNEWGEGHYLAPYREYGFEYLDAVRRVFTDAPEPHTDLIPEDIGMGPYDNAIRAQMQQKKISDENAAKV